MLLQMSIHVEHVSVVYTCNTYVVIHSGPCYLFWSIWSMFLYNTASSSTCYL